MAPRRTRAKDLRRKAEIRPELKTIVVFCEGEASEPDYIAGLKRLPHIHRKASIKIEIDPNSGVPLVLVERAVERGRTDPEIDEIWCMFDVEAPRNHPNLGRAVQLARSSGIRLATSNPCFELWLILHFEDCWAYLSTKEADARSRQLDKRGGKHLDPSVYMPNRREAARRSRELARRHQLDQISFPDNNPSSSMCDFLDSVDPEG